MRFFKSSEIAGLREEVKSLRDEVTALAETLDATETQLRDHLRERDLPDVDAEGFDELPVECQQVVRYILRDALNADEVRNEYDVPDIIIMRAVDAIEAHPAWGREMFTT